jgi:hypothetical protein
MSGFTNASPARPWKEDVSAGKEYVCVIHLHEKRPGGEAQFARALETLPKLVLF